MIIDFSRYAVGDEITMRNSLGSGSSTDSGPIPARLDLVRVGQGELLHHRRVDGSTEHVRPGTSSSSSRAEASSAGEATAATDLVVQGGSGADGDLWRGLLLEAGGDGASAVLQAVVDVGFRE